MKTKKINIPLSDQVVDLETARELTEKLESVGIEVEFNFLWTQLKPTASDGMEWAPIEGRDLFEIRLLQERSFPPSQNYFYWSTYTLPELLEVLPDEIELEEGIFYLSIKKDRAGYWAGDNCVGRSIWLVTEQTNLATAAAKLTIWCIDNGYIKGENDGN